MVAVSTVAEEGGADPVFGLSDESEEEAALTSLPERAKEQTHRPTKVAVKMANVRRGRFIIGYLLETFELRDSPEQNVELPAFVE
jgi:hypothetical protein